jgi:small-conductance mechanosensitive channel
MITRYYFLDWLGMALAFVAMWQIGNRDRRGFIAFILSNVVWIIIGIWISSFAMAAGNAIFLFLNYRGWTRWSPITGADATSSAGPGPAR